MRFTEIGQQLRAYRLESGLRAEEIAARLGVSRAALYRYEKGEVIKLDTIQRLLEVGVAGALPLSDRLRRMCRDVAAAEVENIANLMEAEPMGLQFGLLSAGAEPGAAFLVFRARDRASLAINPFPPDMSPNATSAVAMVTGADEAMAAHQRVAEANWREAVKGTAAATRVRQILAAARKD